MRAKSEHEHWAVRHIERLEKLNAEYLGLIMKVVREVDSGRTPLSIQTILDLNSVAIRNLSKFNLHDV